MDFKELRMNMFNTMSVVYNKSRQAATFEMGLGSNFIEKVVVPYAKSPLTNPMQRYVLFLILQKLFEIISAGGVRG